MGPNKVLGVRDPEIDGYRKSLDRRTRPRLSQLRSGYRIKLESFKFRIELSGSDKCSHCMTEPHTATNHVFNS